MCVDVREDVGCVDTGKKCTSEFFWLCSFLVCVGGIKSAISAWHTCRECATPRVHFCTFVQWEVDLRKKVVPSCMVYQQTISRYDDPTVQRLVGWLDDSDTMKWHRDLSVASWSVDCMLLTLFCKRGSDAPHCLNNTRNNLALCPSLHHKNAVTK